MITQKKLQVGPSTGWLYAKEMYSLRQQEAILKKAPASELRKIAVKNGMTTMLEDGFRKAELGETTIEEILRVVHE